jgi:hypothetical protein
MNTPAYRLGGGPKPQSRNAPFTAWESMVAPAGRAQNGNCDTNWTYS